MAQRNGKSEEEIKKDPEQGGGGADTGSTGYKTSPFRMSPVSTSAAIDELSRIATNLNTNYPTGGILPLPNLDIGTGSNGPYNVSILDSDLLRDARNYSSAGIMTFDWIPTFGIIDSDTSPANLAAKEAYQYTMVNTTGRAAFESVDQTVYTMCVESLYSLYYLAGRVLGLLTQFAPTNNYYPDEIIRNLGFDPDDWRKRKPEAVSRLTQYAAAMAKYPMPPYMEAYKDHILLNSIIFSDGDIKNSQLYAFKQCAFYSYEQVDEAKGVKLIDFNWAGSAEGKFGTYEHPVGVDLYFDLFEHMFNALQNSTDVDIIRSKLIQAWGDAMVNQLPLIGMDYITPIGKSDTMLTSIMNMDIIPVNTDDITIRDVGNGNMRTEIVASVPDTDGIGACFFMNQDILNFVSQAPTADDVAAAMRFKVRITDERYVASYDDPDNVPHMTYRIRACGTELVTQAYTFSFCKENVVWEPIGNKPYVTRKVPLKFKTYNSFISAGTGTEREENAAYQFMSLTQISNFDWHPFVRMGYLYTNTPLASDPTDSDTGHGVVMGIAPPIWDMQNTALLDDYVYDNYIRWFLWDRLFRKA